VNSRTPPPAGWGKLLLAAFLYGLFSIGAFVWSYFSGSGPVFDPTVFSWERAAIGSVAGLTLGLAVVAGSRLLVARFAWARSLYHWFAQVLGPMPDREVLGLALLSSIGEELLFRGAMQPTLGLWLTAVIFGLLHFPPRLRLLPWTVMAGLFGLLFGAITLWSGTIAGAVIAHFTINLLNLREVARYAVDHPPPGDPGEKLPAPDPTPSMGHHDEPAIDADGGRHPGGGDPADDRDRDEGAR
jgi:membrane protease YdiL (CAAX protease family)